METIKNLPKLRFNAFSDTWDEHKLENVFKIRYGKDQKKVINPYGKYPVLGTGGEIGRTNEFLYDKPSVLIGRKGTIDKPKYVDLPFWTVDTLFYTEIYNNTVPKFLYYRLCLVNWYLYNEASGVPSLSSSTICKIKIHLPSLIEQQKIATFLTAIDDKIQQLNRKKKLLDKYKKGVMQQIFNQEIRFKDDDGNEYPAWEEKKLGEIFGIFQGFAFSSNDSKEGGAKWVKIADVGIQNMKTENPSYLPLEFLDTHSKFILKTGDYVIALTRPILNGKLKIAKINTYYDNSLLNQRVGKIISKNDLTFVYYLLQQESVINHIDNSIAGTDPPNLSAKEIYPIPSQIPSKIEQHRIASFLTAIDCKIDLINFQLEKTQVFKKGLLQQMFV